MTELLERIALTAQAILQVVAVLLIVALLGIISLQLVDRHFVSVPIMAPDAWARVFVVWICFIGYALAARAGQAIRVDLFDHLLPPRVRQLLAGLFDLVMMAMLVLLVAKGWLLIVLGNDQAILGTDLTMAVPNAALVVALIALFLFLLARSAARIAALRG